MPRKKKDSTQASEHATRPSVDQLRLYTRSKAGKRKRVNRGRLGELGGAYYVDETEPKFPIDTAEGSRAEPAPPTKPRPHGSKEPTADEVGDALRIVGGVLRNEHGENLAKDQRDAIAAEAVGEAARTWRGKARLSTLATTIALRAAAERVRNERGRRAFAADPTNGADEPLEEIPDRKRKPSDDRAAIRSLVNGCAGHVHSSMAFATFPDHKGKDYCGPEHVARYLAKWIAYEWSERRRRVESESWRRSLTVWLAAQWAQDSGNPWAVSINRARSAVRYALTLAGFSAEVIDAAEAADRVRRHRQRRDRDHDPARREKSELRRVFQFGGAPVGRKHK